MSAAELLSYLAANPIIPIGSTFLVGLLAWATVVLVTSGKRWHERRHTDSLRVFSCDHCMKEWRETKLVSRG